MLGILALIWKRCAQRWINQHWTDLNESPHFLHFRVHTFTDVYFRSTCDQHFVCDCVCVCECLWFRDISTIKTATMAQGCGSSTIKYVLFVFNLLCLVSSTCCSLTGFLTSFVHADVIFYDDWVCGSDVRPVQLEWRHICREVKISVEYSECSEWLVLNDRVSMFFAAVEHRCHRYWFDIAVPHGWPRTAFRRKRWGFPDRTARHWHCLVPDLLLRLLRCHQGVHMPALHGEHSQIRIQVDIRLITNISTILPTAIKYSVALLLLLVAHIAIGALLLVKMRDIKEIMAKMLSKLWDNRSTETEFWDFIQINVRRIWLHFRCVPDFHTLRSRKQFQCCGLNGPQGWGSSLPDSCCGSGSNSCTIDNAYSSSCNVEESLASLGRILGYVAIGAAAVQVFSNGSTHCNCFETDIYSENLLFCS